MSPDVNKNKGVAEMAPLKTESNVDTYKYHTRQTRINILSFFRVSLTENVSFVG